MKHLLFILISLFMHVDVVLSQSADEKLVAEAVENFRKTLVQPNQAAFEKLTSPALSYGHSSGLVEDQKTCIESMINGKFKFESLELTDQTISITGQTAIVRHAFFAHTHDAGKDPGTAKLKVLQVWVKEKGKWLLLARQAVKVL